METMCFWIVVPILSAFLLLRFDHQLWIANSIGVVITATIVLLTGLSVRPPMVPTAVHGLALFVVTAALYSLAFPTFYEWSISSVLRPVLPWLALLTVALYGMEYLTRILNHRLQDK